LASITAVRSFLRTNQDSLLTFIAMSGERVLQMFVGLYVAGSIARGFTHDQFAAWQVAYSLFVVVSTICDVAHERVVLPRLCASSTAQLPRLWNSILMTKVLGGLVAVALLLGWAANAGQPEVFPLAVLWAFYVMLGEPVSLAVFELYAKENFTRPQLTRLAATAGRLAVVVAVVALDGGLLWMVGAWLAEMLILNLLLCRGWAGRIHLSLVDWQLVKSIATQGVALAIAAAASVALTRVDRLVLNAEIPTQVLSHYVAAMTLLEAAFAFSATLLTVLGAKVLFRTEKVTLLHHGELLAFAATVAVVGSVVLSLVATPLVTFVFGDDYLESAHFLRIGAWILPLVFVQGLLQAPLLLHATRTFHLAKSLAALAVGTAAATMAASGQQYDLIISGAYAGFLTLIIFDVRELRRRAGAIYRGHA
jgi:O-antigen/teichoic acid export membrane protein